MPERVTGTEGTQILSEEDNRQRAHRILTEVRELDLSFMEKALVAATRLNEGQTRKGSQIPYISHLMAVAALVHEAGGDEEMAAAALLHDSVEDQEADYADIEALFGPRVSEIVKGCTDVGATDSSEDEHTVENSWRRKQKYLEQLKDEKDGGVLRVSLADKLHNARSILSDYRSVGDELWGRFNVGKQGQLDYYEALAEILGSKLPADAQAKELRIVVDDLKREVGEERSDPSQVPS